MSKERKIDDKDLAEITGAGGIMDIHDADLDDSTDPVQDSSLGHDPTKGSGGTGPNEPDPIGGGGSGNQTPSV